MSCERKDRRDCAFGEKLQLARITMTKPTVYPKDTTSSDHSVRGRRIRRKASVNSDALIATPAANPERTRD